MSGQRTADWFNERAGKVTASKFGAVIGKGKNGSYLKAREDYLIQVVTERLTGEPILTSHGASGEYGKTIEEYALHAFEAETGVIVTESGFVLHPSLDLVGCSPDGLIGEDRGLEIKCPSSSAVHLKTITTGQMPAEHMPQVQGSMWVTGREAWEFVSYDPRMPDHLRLFHQTIERDNEYIQMLEDEVIQFLKDVDEFMKSLPEAA